MIREIYARKIGMTQIFSEEGDLIPTTLLSVEPVYILEKKEYPAKVCARIGCFKMDERKITKLKKPVKGYFEAIGAPVYKLIREVEMEQGSDLPSDSRLVGIEIFSEGQRVDVQAVSKGRGFAGGMKRHGWSGQPMTHGSMMHRRMGSAGANTFPANIFRGKTMAGHMGNCLRTAKNLKVVKIDKEKNILFLKGSLPGPKGVVVRIRKVK